MTMRTFEPAPTLYRLFNPASIVVVGASRDASTISGQPLKFLARHGFAGKLFAVNPSAAEIHGVPCYPSIATLPQCPDLAVIAVRASRVLQAIRECGEKGIAFAQVLTSGFAEIGPQGRSLQQEMCSIAARHGVRLIGPNCQGVISTRSRLYAGFGGPMSIELSVGGLAVASQSGGFGMAIASAADQAGVGIAHVISTGNEADLGVVDFLDDWVSDPFTGMMAAYVEGLKNPRALVDIGRRALAAGKPIIIWKVGASREGARAAASHTANMGGADEFYDAVFDQAGILRAQDIEEVGDLVNVLSGQRLPLGPAVGVLTVSGGAGVAVADALAAYGCQVPALTERTRSAIEALLPDYVTPGNPIDVTGGLFNSPELFGRALDVMLEEASFDSLVIMMAAVPDSVGETVAAEILKARQRSAKPIVVWYAAREHDTPRTRALLRQAAIAVLPTPYRTGRAVGRLTQYAQARQRLATQPLLAELEAQGMAAAQAPVRMPPAQTEHEAKKLLESIGLPITHEALATTPDHAVAAADRIGYPVAVKLQATSIAHKSDIDGVRLNLRDAAQVREAAEQLITRALGAGVQGLAGVLVQEMVLSGHELIVGGTVDERFGPMVMVGMGGIYAETLRDTAFRCAPVTAVEAQRMIGELRIAPILAGLRGRAGADVDALTAAIVRFSEWLHTHRAVISEVDINPLVVRARGDGVVVVDAHIASAGEVR